MKHVILASQSPRRKELLEKCIRNFAVCPADIDETLDPDLPAAEAVRQLSVRKAEAVLRTHPEAVVIGSDTVVAADGVILGKPADRSDAERMLKMLSGKTHQVITGLCIMSTRKVFSDVSCANVTFAALSEDEIESYIMSGEPMDKAGSYAIQGEAGRFITCISGDYYTIVGLPLNMAYEELKKIEEY
ncbi:MAG: Maf family protein [Solobacterium sp.]|nr:Maf family protein [Solobacterium sp.]